MRMATSAVRREEFSAAHQYDRELDDPRGRRWNTNRITSSRRSDMTAADHLWSGHHSLPRPVNRHPARLRSSAAAAFFKLLYVHKIRQLKQWCRQSSES